MLYKRFLDLTRSCDLILLVCRCKVTAVLLFARVGSASSRMSFCRQNGLHAHNTTHVQSLSIYNRLHGFDRKVDSAVVSPNLKQYLIDA